ncbi:MAG: sigma-54 dependent transcriptional regulator [Polyangiales bacterium]
MTTRILVCDDETSLREMLAVLLRRAGHQVETVAGVKAAVATLAKEEPFDAVITDLLMPDGSGMEVLEAARARDDSTQVIMITAYATTEQAVQAMRLGAYDYVQKPFKNEELRATLEKALEKRAIVDENRKLRAQVHAATGSGKLLGRGPAMQRVRDLIARVANSPASVLITGESGTGKEVVARELHLGSDRKDRPFIVVNCGALPEALMESELFGHEKGSFTGATTAKEGLVRSANGGTLFLDEIGELPLPLQVKLLRVLQEKAVRPVGASKELSVDVRVVAATNRELEVDVKKGVFRQDLFYRLNVIRIHLPPLRERPEDILLLAEHFLSRHAAATGKKASLSPEVQRWLVSQPFHGNVRELENVMERALTLAAGSTIELSDIPEATPTSTKFLPQVAFGPGFDLDRYLADVERSLLHKALEEAGGVRTNAAKLLGMSFRSFRYRLAKVEGGVTSSDSDPDDGS